VRVCTLKLRVDYYSRTGLNTFLLKNKTLTLRLNSFLLTAIRKYIKGQRLVTLIGRISTGLNGRIKVYQRGGSMDDDYEGFVFTSGEGTEGEDSLIDEAMRNRISEETFFLAPDRLYIVFDSVGVDTVTVRAYDTLDATDVSAAHILQQGMLSLLETDYDYLMQLGHEATLDRISEEQAKKDSKKLTVDEVYDNVIQVKFSEDN